MIDRSYSDLSDSATTFDPEEQLDRDIDERMKGMTREEACARAMHAASGSEMAYDDIPDWAQLRLRRMFNAALAASTIWDAEQTPMYRLAMAQNRIASQKE
jgi:hypothetical protein